MFIIFICASYAIVIAICIAENAYESVTLAALLSAFPVL